MAFFRQLRLMLWKNWLIQKRKICVTIFEVILPLIFAGLLLLLRTVVQPTPLDRVTIYPVINLTRGLNKNGFIEPNNTIIGYTPNVTGVETLMGYMKTSFQEHTPEVTVTFQGFSTEDEMLKFFHLNSRIMRHCITFYNMDTSMPSIPRHVKFNIRPFSGDERFRTRWNYSPRQYYGPRENDILYEERGVLYMQRLVGESLIKYWLTNTGGNPNTVDLGTYSQRMAYPPYVEDEMIAVLQDNLPIFLVLSFILSVVVNVKNLVYEKERKLKESMKLMGLKASVHWLSWFLTFAIYLVPSLFLYAIFIGTDIIKDKGPILTFSDTSLLFVFLLIYGFSLITFCFMVSSFAQKANVGATLAGILFFGIYAPHEYLSKNYQDLDKFTKLGCSILFNCAMGLGAKVIGFYEGLGEGVQWNNFHLPATVDDDLSLLECMIMMLVDSFIHLIIFWYVENVWPGEFGVPKPFYFCFTESYWYGAGKKARDTSYLIANEEANVRFEKEPTNRKPGIQIRNLRKVYNNKTAVDGLNLNMFEGQISVLLGHNGAGKTTTMSILTGFIPPTSGSAIVNEYDITKNIDGVRSSLGLCPQHNILFDNLTVKEHLEFYARLKGASNKEAIAEILPLITEVGLLPKIHDRSSNLSGGQKRKLSVAIALVAGSKIVILDEPSSGMDPAARRQTWDVLQNHREGRTMVLTTHYMDEADVLGDRIAIMAEGVVNCCGSSMFLKKLYGAGYHFVVVKNASCNVDEVTKIVLFHIANAKLESIINMEVTYLLPDKETAEFPSLFTELDQRKHELGISSFGTTATTMEEVFLKVGDSAVCNDDTSDNTTRETNKNGHTPSYTEAPGAGYHFVVVKNASCNVDEVTKIVLSHIANAKLESIINMEVTYLLPDKETAEFPSLFTELDQRKHELGISSFGTTATTMEEVLLKVGDSAVCNDDTSDNTTRETNKNGHTPSYTEAPGFNIGFTRKTGMAREMSMIYALFVKKALHTWRHRTITIVQLLLPALFTVVGLAIDASKPASLVEPPYTFDLSAFGRTKIPSTTGRHNTTAKYPNNLAAVYDQQFGKSHDVESFDLSKYKLFDVYTLKKGESMGIGTFNKRVIVGLEVGGVAGGESIHAISHYNGQPFHAQPIGVNYLMNSLLQFYLNASYSLQSGIHPLPQDLKDSSEFGILLILSGGFVIGLFISFGMAFLTTLFIHFLIKERQVGAKHLQVVSGVGPFSYWLPTFLWDFINYFIPCLLLLAAFACYSKSAYVDEEQPLFVIMVLIVYGWAMIPFMYALQFAFDEPPTGVVTVIMLNIVSGMVCLVATFVLNIPSLDAEALAETCDQIFMAIFPNYAMAQSFVNLYTNYYSLEECANINCLTTLHPCCKDTCDKVGICYAYQENFLSFDKPGIGSYIIFMVLQGFVYFTIVLLIEYHVFQKIWYFIKFRIGSDIYTSETRPNQPEDSDVAAERQRINYGLKNSDSLLLVNLFKQYGQFVAVDHICVGIPEEECFGLLGQNGAGKTTTFKMLTGDVMVTGGNAYLTGYDVRNNIKEVQANMGYCPQFDALIDQMTGRETLTMYARLRGVPEENIKHVVNHLIDILMFSPHADKLSGAYSGGNKRKLSTAIALVGDPHFIMLDEPSAGMDPKARRQLWTVLSQVRASGRTLILTSHSMEECDALCTRIAIMVNGRFVCLGSPQHLKNKFGQGYTLIVQLGALDNGQTAPIDAVVNFVCENFPGTQVFDDHQGYVHFQVPDSTVKLADVFSLMETTKANLNVRDYSVHQTTLEQVFLTFTRSQVVPKEKEKRGVMTELCSCCCLKTGCMK